MSTLYAAVHGDVGDPIDVCQADCRESYEDACALARAVRDKTGRATRVVKIFEAAMYPARTTGPAR